MVHPSTPRTWEQKGLRTPAPATWVIRLTRASWGLWDAFTNDATSVIHHGGRLELHRLHHIPNADLQRKCNHGGSFSSPAWLHLAHGSRALAHSHWRRGRPPQGAPGRGAFERDSPKQIAMRSFLFYLIIPKSERLATSKGPVPTS